MSEIRLNLEVALPGALIGLLGGAVAGGLAGLAGLPGAVTVIAAVALALPLAVAGAGYDLLLAAGKMRLGGVAPAVVYWLVAFPLARLIHQGASSFAAVGAFSYPDGVWSFLAYQAILSIGFTIGFIWLHEHLGPVWWLRIRGHNPVAGRYVEQYMQQAAAMQQKKGAGKTRRGTGRDRTGKTRA